MLIHIVVASEQDLVVQYFFAKAVVHAGMNRRSLYKA